MPLSEQQLLHLMKNSRQAIAQLDKADCENSLLSFIKQAWHVLEPGMQLVHGWALSAICDHLEAVTKGQLTRLLINVPPGCTKSMSCNVFWPSWEWGPKNMPHMRYISCSYSKELSTRDNVRGRDLLQSEWYQSRWADRLEIRSDQNNKMYFENTYAGWRKASSSGATLTGFRGDRIVLDDPHSVQDAESERIREETLRWFSETLPSRLNRLSESAIVVVMQRVHERDVSGLILAKELGYEHLMLPMEFEPERRCFSTVPPSFRKVEPVTTYFNRQEKAWQIKPIPVEEDPHPRIELRYPIDPREKEGELLDPERFPRLAVEQLKQAFRSWGGSYAEVGQLQQRPSPRGGGMFKKSSFIVLDIAPKQGRTVRAWDLAATKEGNGAYTVGVKMRVHEGSIYVLDVERFRGSPKEVEDRILSCANRDGRNCVISLPQDPGQSGKSQKRSLAVLLHGFDVQFSPESGSKEDRARPYAAQVEAGNVFLLRGPWIDDYLNEAATFPVGEYKDQIDASSRAYSYLIAKRPRRIGVSPVLEILGGGSPYRDF